MMLQPRLGLLKITSQDALLWCSAVAVAIVQSIPHLFALGADGIAYVDMSDAVTLGPWERIINRCWSPLYPLLVGLARLVCHPQPYWQIPVVIGLNVFLYACTAFAYLAFLKELQNLRARSFPAATRAWTHTFPHLCFVLFLLASRDMLRPFWTSPDVLVAGLIFVDCWLVLRLLRSSANKYSVLLGMSLGTGYWTKTILLPLAIFLCMALALCRSRLSVRVMATTLTLFLLLATPLVCLLSKANHGRATIGSSGLLNYSWFVNHNIRYKGWLGDNPVYGHPIHLVQEPTTHPELTIYPNIPGTIQGTYPAWDDPAFWYEGVRLDPDAEDLVNAVLSNSRHLLGIIAGPRSAVLLWLIPLTFMIFGKLINRDILCSLWVIFVPQVLLIALYVCVSVKERYVAPMLLVSAACLMAAVDTDLRFAAASRWISRVLLAGVILFELAFFTASSLSMLHRARSGVELNEPWLVTTYLEQNGLRAGDSVGTVGLDFFVDWARLGGFTVRAEVTDPGRFLIPESAYHPRPLFTPQDWPLVASTFQSVPVKAVLAEKGSIPAETLTANWEHIAGTDIWCWFPEKP